MAQAVWGRESELTFAARVLEPRIEDPVALVLTGDEGIGKTTVWSGVLSQAEERGFRVLSARPVESEATLAFAAIADLLRDGFDEAVISLPAPQRIAMEAALLRGEGEGFPDPRALAFGFYGSLLALARSAPLAIGVDDAQWLDVPSARVLGFALRRMEGVPVAAVLAMRTTPETTYPSPLGLEERWPEERIHQVPLSPLDLDTLRRILLSRLATRLPHWVLVEIHEASGGNPFLALELARALERRGPRLRPGDTLEIPGRLVELLDERLALLPDPVRKMLLLIAASPQPTLASIARALEDPPGFEHDVRVALEADVIEIAGDRIRFANPVLGTALYSGSPSAERQRAHRILADVASDAEERVRHLALASDGPDERVARLLEDAAQRARSRGSPDAAAQLAELSRDMTPADRVDTRTRRTANAGRYAFESAQIERADELLHEAAAASTGPMLAEALLYLSRVHYHRRDVSSAARLTDRALREARHDPALQASINLERSVAAEAMGKHRSATALARRSVELAERSGARTVIAESVAVLGFYEFLSGKGFPRARLDRARSHIGEGPPLRPLRSPSFYEACMLAWSDDLTGARERLRELEHRARDTGDESSLSVFLSILSQIDSWAGEWTRAARQAEEAGVVAEWADQPPYLALALYAQALVESLAGEIDRALDLGKESLLVAERTGSVQLGELARSVLGSAELSRGDAREADAWLSDLVEAMSERGPADPGTLRFLPDEVEALVGLGEIERAELLLDPFERRARKLGRSWALGAAARCRGLALASRRELEGALKEFDVAIERQRNLEQPLELGRSYLAKGVALRRGKKWGPARDSLNGAARIFERLGARTWSHRTAMELNRIGGRAPNLDVLTETEQRVADLVATGLTNREAAARLFLSVSTVESNLRRAYRKLGVRSRTELSHRLSSAPASGGFTEG